MIEHAGELRADVFAALRKHPEVSIVSDDRDDGCHIAFVTIGSDSLPALEAAYRDVRGIL